MITWKEHLKSWRIDMTREDLINAMPIIKAFIDGKKLQYKDLNHEWEDLEVNDLDLDDFVESAWRIKPEPKYRAFKDAEECWQEMSKHQPFGWMKNKEDGHHALITAADDDTCGMSLNGNAAWSLSGIMDLFTFADGSPFGVKLEE